VISSRAAILTLRSQGC